MTEKKPTRVQLSRKKGWRMPPNTVKVDRTTPFGNPFPIGKKPDDSVLKFAVWLEFIEEGQQLADRARRELRGKNLACWCPLDGHCHADVLLRLAAGGKRVGRRATQSVEGQEKSGPAPSFRYVHRIGESGNLKAFNGAQHSLALLVRELWQWSEHDDGKPATRLELEQLADAADVVMAREILRRGEFDTSKVDLCWLILGGLMREGLSPWRPFRDRWLHPPILAAAALRILDGMLADNFTGDVIGSLAEVARLSFWAVGAAKTAHEVTTPRRHGSIGGQNSARRWRAVQEEAMRLALAKAPPGGWPSAPLAASHIKALVSDFARSKGEAFVGDPQRQVEKWLREGGIKRARNTS